MTSRRKVEGDSSMALGWPNGRGICTVLESLAAYGKGWIARTLVERTCVGSRSMPGGGRMLYDLLRSPVCRELVGWKRSPAPLPAMGRESNERGACVRRDWTVERYRDRLSAERLMATERP